MQKTITINGTRYTASRLKKIAAERGIEMTGGDTAIELTPGCEVAITQYNTGEIGVRNYGGASRKKSAFGALIAVLA